MKKGSWSLITTNAVALVKSSKAMVCHGLPVLATSLWKILALLYEDIYMMCFLRPVFQSILCCCNKIPDTWYFIK